MDRLGSLVAPESPREGDFVSGVMRRVRSEVAGDSPGPLRPSPRGWRAIRLAVAAAACLVVALGFWAIAAAHHSPPAIATNGEQKEIAVPAALPSNAAAVENASVETVPAIRKSTWSVVTESVVLEGDMPVRKLFYREFERVEVLDSQGNPESSLVVPTKAMLVANQEQVLNRTRKERKEMKDE